MKTLLAEPMVHFVVLGAVLFGAYRWESPRGPDSRRIVITQGVVDDLVTQQLGARGRRPTADELTRLIDTYVRDEVLYREGVTLGLDRDDIVVKRRVRQKVEVMQEEELPSNAPMDAELSAYLEAHRARFMQPAVFSFEQIFLGFSSSKPGVLRAVALARDAVSRGDNPDGIGTPTLLPRAMQDAPADQVARDFGAPFADALAHAPVGTWAGPVASSFGVHYVCVSARTESAVPTLAEVRDAVLREWENARRRRARDESYAKMRGSYTVDLRVRLPQDQ